MTGATLDKEQVRKAMVYKAYVIAQAARLYAQSISNMELLEQLKAPLSEWQYYHKHLAQVRTMLLLQSVQPLADALTDYGLQPADLTELETLLEAYSARMDVARHTVIQRTLVTQAIKVLFQQGDGQIQALDRLFLQQSGSPFYIRYKSARKIVRRRPRGEGVQGNTVEV